MTTKIASGKELFDAIEAKNFGLVSRLLEQGIDVNIASDNGWTPLMLAILHNSTDLVKLLLEQNADPNMTTQSEENPCRSPLAVAVSNARLEAVKLLMAYHVNIDMLDSQGLTAIDLAQKLASRPLHRGEMNRLLFLLKEYQRHPLSSPTLVAGRSAS